MKRHWIEYHPTAPTTPMTPWVHRPTNGQPFYTAHAFDPPRPGPIGDRGYALYLVTVRDVTLEFSSLDELRHGIAVLERKLLPRLQDLAATVRAHAGRANAHWLSRLPSALKPWRVREPTVAYLRQALADWERPTRG